MEGAALEHKSKLRPPRYHINPFEKKTKPNVAHPGSGRMEYNAYLHQTSRTPKYPASADSTATVGIPQMRHTSLPIPRSYNNIAPHTTPARSVPRGPQSSPPSQGSSRFVTSPPFEPDLFRPLPALPPYATGASTQKGRCLPQMKPRNTNNSSMPIGKTVVGSSRRSVISPDGTGLQAGVTPMPASSSTHRGSGVSSRPSLQMPPPHHHEPFYDREESLLRIRMPPYLSTIPADADADSECSWDSRVAIADNTHSQYSSSSTCSGGDSGDSRSSASKSDTSDNSDYLYDEIDQLMQQMSRRHQPVLGGDGHDEHQDSLVFPLPSPYEKNGYESDDDESVLGYYSPLPTAHSDVIYRPNPLRRTPSDFTLSEVVYDGPALFAEKPIYEEPYDTRETLYGNNKHGEKKKKVVLPRVVIDPTPFFHRDVARVYKTLHKISSDDDDDASLFHYDWERATNSSVVTCCS